MSLEAAPVRSGIIGTGFMGTVHTRAVRAAGGEVRAYAGRDLGRVAEAAAAARVPHVLSAYELIAHPEIDLVHICTPNAQHLELARAAIAAGKHVVCEKPLAASEADARELVEAAAQAGVVAAVPFVYRFYPTAREARARIREGGERVWLAHGHYLQDWLAERSSYNWRVADGDSRAFADIGVHWCDLFEFVTGHRISRLLAQRSRLHETRVRGAQEIPVETEDGVTMLFETDGGATGSLVVSQATHGRKNRLWLSVDGESHSYAFDQEAPNELWVGASTGVSVIPKGVETTSFPDVARYVTVPSGHPQGYQDCFASFITDVHRAIAGEAVDGLPTFADGARAARLTEAVIESSQGARWVETEPSSQPHRRIA